MSGLVFHEYAQYYDLLYKDKDYAGEADYIHRLIERHHPGAKTLLELGSGTGKHAVLLAERGYRIHGVERSETMLARSAKLVTERKPYKMRCDLPVFSQGDIRTARVDQIFNVVISLFHVISYQTSNEDLLAAFATARQHLAAGGLFIFDVWYGPAVLTDRPAVRVKRMADDQIEVTRLAEPVLHASRNVVEVNYDVRIRDKATGKVSEHCETHPMRYLFTPELEIFLSESGFQMLHSEEWMTGKTPGFDTWGVCFVAKAK
jgi:SAM-dependent methyltransferase